MVSGKGRSACAEPHGDRLFGVFSIPCSIWEVLSITPIREEGMRDISSRLLMSAEDAQVEFRVNNVKQDYAMKLGEGGEAFFVFETSDDIPESLQTSPLVSPATSPQSLPAQDAITTELQEPDFLDLSTEGRNGRGGSSAAREAGVPFLSAQRRAQSELGMS